MFSKGRSKLRACLFAAEAGELDGHCLRAERLLGREDLKAEGCQLKAD